MKTIDGVTHYYYLSGSQIIAEEWENILCLYLYDADGSPIGMQYRNIGMTEGSFCIYWFEKNLQGDIVAVYSDSGVKLRTYTYDAWGNVTETVLSQSGTNYYARYNPFRYRGYYYDTETGLYYLQSRYYNPEWGRFLNADSCLYSSMLGFNMFVYCDNNPVNYIDPYGDDATAVLEWWMAIGGAISLVDGPLPVIDIIVIGGAAIIYACNYDEINNYVQSTTDGIWNAAEEAPESTPEETEKPADNVPAVPDIKYPGDDPTVAPGEDYEWRGKPPSGSDKGAWYNKTTGESLHPDFNHPGMKPHYDYNYKGSGTAGWRIFPDGSILPK